MAAAGEVSAASATDAMTRDTVLAGCQERDWMPDPGAVLSFGDEEQASVTEVFRALRSRLCQLQKSSPLKSLLIASALAGEGRSFVALNLARIMALQPECRVLLIDGDLRNSTLHSALGTSSIPGLSEYLLQELEEFGIMQRGDAGNFFFIPSGRSVTGSTELVGNGRLKALMDKVEPLFDWIIVDSPATAPVSDACLLADYLDGVLMVVRSRATPYDVVRKACQRFREESLVGVVLNEGAADSKPHASSSGRKSTLKLRG